MDEHFYILKIKGLTNGLNIGIGEGFTNPFFVDFLSVGYFFVQVPKLDSVKSFPEKRY